MTQTNVVLPSEVWTNVFGYLSTADRSSVRASCKRFQQLVDHWSLWRDWAPVLDAKAPYNGQFWATLRRRRVASVLVRRSNKDKMWRVLAASLPDVSTVVMERCPALGPDCLQGFLNLRRLAIWNSSIPNHLNAFTVCQPELLTHLSLCNVNMSRVNFISDISCFTNLVSLVHHGTETFAKPFQVADRLRVQHPRLKNLSLSVYESDLAPTGPVLGSQEPAQASLLSFELVGGTHRWLPVDAMKTMPDLKSFTVFYKQSSRAMPQAQPLSRSCMERWLSDLRHLSTLTVVAGPEVKAYASSIPATVTNLTLCVPGISPEDMATVALQVPDLLHLHIDPWPSSLGAHTAQIPRLFPKLRTLKLCHEHVPEKNFLELCRLQNLETLEVLDFRPHLPELAEKLRALTDNRLKVIISSHQRGVMSCPCVSRVY